MFRYKPISSAVAEEGIGAAARALMTDDRIVFAYLFGGLVRGRTPLSDVDIAVYLRDLENIGDYKMDLIVRLSLALGTDELDLVILNTAPISLSGRILMGRKVLVDKAPFVRHDYESLTLRMFHDFSYHEKRILEMRYRHG